MRSFLVSCLFTGLMVVMLPLHSLHACDVCGCSFNAQRSEGDKAGGGAMITTPTATTLGQGHGAVGFLFEGQRFHSYSAEEAETLIADGHDIHGKDHEEFYNLSAG